MLFFQHVPRGEGVLFLGHVRGQGHFGERVRSREKHLQAHSWVMGQRCLLKQQVADLFPATSDGACQEVNMLPRSAGRGKLRPPACCATHALERTSVIFYVKGSCVSPLSATRTTLSSTDTPRSHQQPPLLAIPEANGGFHLTCCARASTMVISHMRSAPSYPQQRSLPTLLTCKGRG